MRVPAEAFREYDIRGIVGETLDSPLARLVGRSYGSELGAGQTVAVGHDNRPSSPELASALCEGLNGAGVDVLLVGTVPTPTLYFAEREMGAAGGIQITGSHNPPEYNGIKLTVGGRSLYGKAIQGLRERIEGDAFETGSGRTRQVEILPRYVEEIGRRATVAPPLRFVLDCGNGTGSVVAADALRATGAEVDTLFCESDGTFPNHHPDPTVDENVRDLIDRVISTGAAFGVGLDGDADRIGAVTEKGDIIRGDHLLLLYALDVLKERPGAEIIFDVKCSKALPEMIEQAGGVPVMWKTGHSLIKERMYESGSPVSGEMSGHICFADRYFGFDDAIYAAARLGVAGPDERPTSVEKNPGAVDIDDVVRSLVVGHGALDHAELALLGALQSQLRRRGIRRNPGRDLGERTPFLGDELGEPSRGVDRIVESEIPVSKTDMTTHLT